MLVKRRRKLYLQKKDKTTLNLPPEALELPIIKFRENLFAVLQDRDFPIDERVDNLLTLIGAKSPDNVDWYSVFNGLEKLDSAWDTYLIRIKDGIQSPVPNNSLDTAYEQLLVYLVFRHFTDCRYDEKLTERVLFAVLIYKVIKAMNKSNSIKELLEIARLYSGEIEYSDQNINTLLLKLSAHQD